jgi:putative FmdB family regulatory protein
LAAHFVESLGAGLGQDDGLSVPNVFQVSGPGRPISEENLYIRIKAWMKGKDHGLTLPCGGTIFLFNISISFRSETMPIYEFRCLKCGHIFENLVVSSIDDEKLSCPECREFSFERVVSRTNYVMGSGAGGQQAKVTTKSCGASNKCMTMDIPGPTK